MDREQDICTVTRERRLQGVECKTKEIANIFK